VQCTATKRFLDSRGLEYTTVDVTDDPDALAFIKGLGYLAAPVVYTAVYEHGGPPHEHGIIEHWSGNQPDRIKAIVK
jgi:glutaredoxin-like protein NrdH